MRSAGALAVAIAIGVAACTGEGSGDPAPTVVTTTTLPPAPRVDDGVLRIGALVPDSDTGLATTLTDVVAESAERIDAAGGVLGQPVDVVFEEAGATSVTAEQAIETLVRDGVDAIIGPLSSNNAIAALDQAVNGGVVTCSPTASSIALDDFPDDNLFFRTIAPDSLQAVAIADQARNTGETRIAVAHIDDAYGRPYARAVARELGTAEFAEVTLVPIPVGADDVTAELDQVADADAQIVIALGSGADTSRFLTALAERPSIELTTVLVNDDVRSPVARPVIAELPQELRERIVGLAPVIVTPATADEPASEPFASQIEDCVNLIGLAALQAESDAPEVIASQMSSVSAGGIVCQTFEECADQLERDLEIDYDGALGTTDLGRNGDPDRARFERFGFDDEGSDVDSRPITVGDRS